MPVDSNKSTPLAPPAEWPSEILEEYEPVRVLGRGGFGSVVLAKRIRARAEKASSEPVGLFVAMKVVGSATPSKVEEGYAHREIDILRELSHPNIMRLLHVWEPAQEARRCAAVMALSYAPGPTMEYILKKIGAPSLTFCRVVSAQFIDAVAYLHSHAVIHRDLKPDNIVITGASLKQDAIFQDVEETQMDWKMLREKWHVTLVDFGFARALGPDDINRDVGLRNSMKATISTPLMTDDRDLDRSLNDSMTNSSSQIGRARRGSIRRNSLSSSRHFLRTMSALGHHAYAAPEVQNRIRREYHNLDEINDESLTRQKNTLSPFVADYGMVADAFSAGSTIRYILTGVHPDEKVEDVISAQKAPIAKVGRFLRKTLAKKKAGGTNKRTKTYRASNDVPAEAVRMVRGMTHADPRQRTTVRSARLFPWVDDVLEPSFEPPRHDMKFLKCATKKQISKEAVHIEPTD